jgi:hypothetical protein
MVFSQVPKSAQEYENKEERDNAEAQSAGRRGGERRSGRYRRGTEAETCNKIAWNWITVKL